MTLGYHIYYVGSGRCSYKAPRLTRLEGSPAALLRLLHLAALPHLGLEAPRLARLKSGPAGLLHPLRLTRLSGPELGLAGLLRPLRLNLGYIRDTCKNPSQEHY